MEEPEPPKGAMTLVYLIAIALIGFGLLAVGLYWGECLVHKEPVKIIRFVLPAIPVTAGVVIMVRAKVVANWIAEKLE